VEQGLQKAIGRKTGVIPTQSIQFPEAHKEIVATLVDEVVMNTNERGKGRIDAYRTLLEIEGSLGNIKRPDQGEVAGIQINLSQDAAKFMIAGLLRARERQASDTIEGSFKVTDDE
jgi:DNA helicase HerA-like ATPase